MSDAGFQTNTVRTIQLLQRAVRERLVALLEPRIDAPDTPVSARLVAVTQDGLRVRAQTHGGDAPLALIGVYCDGQIVIDDTPYVFETYVSAIESDADGPLIVLGIPSQLTVLERRLKPRVRLARSADVHVRWGSTIDPQIAVAKLLNLSAQGIACQLDAASAAGILIGDTAEIAVPIGDDESWIELPATVRNKTEGSSPSAVLIGMEFNHQEMPADLIERLRRHVNERSTTRAS